MKLIEGDISWDDYCAQFKRILSESYNLARSCSGPDRIASISRY
jgi:hypothetical protein